MMVRLKTHPGVSVHRQSPMNGSAFTDESLPGNGPPTINAALYGIGLLRPIAVIALNGVQPNSTDGRKVFADKLLGAKLLDRPCRRNVARSQPNRKNWMEQLFAQRA